MIFVVLPQPRPQYNETREKQVEDLANLLAAWINPFQWALSQREGEPPGSPPPFKKDNGNYQLDVGNDWFIDTFLLNEGKVRISHRYRNVFQAIALQGMLIQFGGYVDVTMT